MNKYLAMRKQGELVNRLFYLARDSYTENMVVSSSPHIPWFTRIIKKIKTKEDVINYHKKKLEKITKSKYIVLSDIEKETYNNLMKLIDNTINEKTKEYEDISEVANKLRNQIPVPMLFSIFSALKLNAFEIIIALIIFVLFYFILF